MKKILSLIFVLAFSLQAKTIPELHDYQDTSLLAFEGGVAQLSMTPENNTTFGYGGFKIGAQSKEYRIFLSLRNYTIKDFNYANSYGLEFDYLMPLNDTLGFFFGGCGGLMNLQYSSTEGSRSFSTPYFGVESGFNLNISQHIAFEFGARYLSINAKNTRLNATKTAEVQHSIDNMLNGYASFIIKFTLDP